MRCKVKTNRIIKGLSFILSLLIICSAISSITVFAESKPRIVVSQAEAKKAGETVDLTVSLENNPGIVAATLKVVFDESVLTLKGVKDEGVLGSHSHKPELTSPYTLAWANDTATQNYTVNDKIVTLTFLINGTAKPGNSYPVELTYDYNNYDIYDKDLNLVKFDVENGKISLKAEDATTQPVTDASTEQLTTEVSEAPTTEPYTQYSTTEPTQPATDPSTISPSTEPTNVPPTEPSTDEPSELADGYYLVGSIQGDNSWDSKIHKDLIFHENALSVAFGEYILPSVELSAADAVKVVSVKNQEVSRWYPEGVYNDYIIEEDGTYTVYFRPDGVGADNWWDGVYGNFFFVEKDKPTQPTDDPTQPATDSDVKALIKAENVSAVSGSTIDVPIVISDNPGIVGMTLTVKYDTSALRLTGVKDGSILGDAFHKPEFKSPYTLSWANDTATQNFTDNGTIATLEFSVNDNAEKGKSYPIELSYNYDNYDIYDKDLNLVKFSVENGQIYVKSEENPTEASSETTTEQSTTEATEQPTTAPGTNPTTDEPTQPVTDPNVSALIKAESISSVSGSTVDVPITISDNPGIVGMTLTVKFDTSALRLTGVKDGGILGSAFHKPEFKSPYTLSWANDTATENYNANGILATLSFEILDGAEGSYPISLSYNYDNYDIYDKDLNLVKFNIINGMVDVSNHTTEQDTTKPRYKLGDVNMDGGIDVRDATEIQRYIAKIIDLTDEQLILADVNKDGGIDVRDATTIKRAIAKIISFDF